MSERVWRVALIDSGVDHDCVAPVREIRRFEDRNEEVVELDPTGDPTGHGTLMAAIIACAERPIELLVAQVTNPRGCCTPAAVAAGVRWALGLSADLIHLSLGLRYDRPVLASAIAMAVGGRTLVVASTPARGAAAYPAAYPGVIRATGDARCSHTEIACIATPQADFGACALHASAHRRSIRGASVGAAHLSRFIVSHLSPILPAAAVRARLAELAAYHGAERRLA